MAKSDYFGGTRPTFGAFLTMNVPIFDGFARRHKLDMAEADLHQAENELAGARDSAARDVWKAYTGYRTALKKQDAAEKLRHCIEERIRRGARIVQARPEHVPRGCYCGTKSNRGACDQSRHAGSNLHHSSSPRTRASEILPARRHHSSGSHEDENGICASRPGQQQQSSTSPARSVSAGRACRVGPAHRGIGVRGSTVESPLTYDRYSRFLFSGLDDLHCKRADADACRALDCANVPSEAISRSGAVRLFMPDDHLHVCDLDPFLSKLKCIKQPVLQTRMSQALLPQR